MKVVHVVLGKANPNRMNGVNKVVNSLASAQAALGLDVELWGITPTPKLHNYPTRAYGTKLFKALKNKLKIDASLAEAIRGEETGDTVFHLHGGFIPEFYHLSKLLKKHGFAYVYTPHGAYNQVALQKSRWLKKLYFPRVERMVAEGAAALHFMGESEQKYAGSLFAGSIPSLLIPNGQEAICSDLPSRGQPSELPIFTTCGRIDIHTKGLDLMLRGFELFLGHSGAAEWWIVGDGGEVDQLRRLVDSRGLGDAVRFLGAKFGDEKFNILAQSTAFFQPSRNEGLPGAVLEAAVSGLPLVVSTESNMGSYVKKHRAGICLEDNVPIEIADAMYKIHHKHRHYPGSLAQWGGNARQMAKEEFDWGKIALQHIENYRNLGVLEEVAEAEMVA